jgi:hypothetical protein
MEVSSPATLSTPAGDITFNNDGDLYVFTKLDGFDEAELRSTVDVKSRQDGAVIHAIYAGAMLGTCEGWVLVTNPTDRNDAEDQLAIALRSIRSVDGTFTVTPTGQGSKSLTVRNNVELRTAIVSGTLHSFTFGLVAADPFWA